MAKHAYAVLVIIGWLIAHPALSSDIEKLDRELDIKLEEFDRAIDRQNSGQEVDILSQNGRSMPLDQGSAFDEVSPGEISATVMTGPTEDGTIAGRASDGSGMESGDAQAGDPAEAGSSSDGQSDQGAGGDVGDSDGGLAIPEDIGDGQGDDIVLRQIREAAMRETDPALRDKLWAEYRRIKGQ